MILDEIIALLGSIIGYMIGGIIAGFVIIINLIAAGIEFIVGLFVAGYKLGRIERKKSSSEDKEEPSKASGIASFLTLLSIVGVIGLILLVPKIMSRTVTLVAKDGHSLPFAAVILHTNDGDQYVRTDNAGNIVIPRFGTNSLTIKDARYVERTWRDSEIESKLTVDRTILGSGLDILADRLLKPKKE